MKTISHNEKLPEYAHWSEWRMSGCPNGCKIYRAFLPNSIGADINGYVYILAHNSNYGCSR